MMKLSPVRAVTVLNSILLMFESKYLTTGLTVYSAENGSPL